MLYTLGKLGNLKIGIGSLMALKETSLTAELFLPLSLGAMGTCLY